MFSTIGHDKHKARRAALNRFFSMASVRRLQPVIGERVQKLLERLQDFRDAEGEIIKMDYAFAAFTNGTLSKWILWHLPHAVRYEAHLSKVCSRCRHGICLRSIGPPPRR